jgi:hypothetical protein
LPSLTAHHKVCSSSIGLRFSSEYIITSLRKRTDITPHAIIYSFLVLHTYLIYSKNISQILNNVNRTLSVYRRIAYFTFYAILCMTGNLHIIMKFKSNQQMHKILGKHIISPLHML